MEIPEEHGAKTAPPFPSVSDLAHPGAVAVMDVLTRAGPLRRSPEDREVDIRSNERDRIARELHDSTSELLIVLDLQLIRLKQLCATGSNAFDEVLSELGATVMELHEGVRALSERESFDPRALTHDLMAMATEFGRRTGLVMRVEIGEQCVGFSPDIARALYRLSQEALANVSRHAKASNVSLSLDTDSDGVRLRIADDGIGFPRDRAASSRGHGIANMKARIEEVGGK